MRPIIAAAVVLFAASGLSGCVAAAAGAVVGTTVGVAGAVVGTTAKATGAVVGAGVHAVVPKKKKKPKDDPSTR
ncbi:MAG TPA: hypothetical protein VG407_16160 [Caulobacteraceae bacterium]|nr:hypothetical protein [Caulobacteraceae bacterium]